MKIVALRALGLGDMLTAVPALRALEREFPDHERLLAAPKPLAPIAELIGWQVVHTEALAPLPSELHGADVAVNLHGRGPQSHRALVASRPKWLIAFQHRAVPETAGKPHWTPGEHEVERWCRLLRESAIPARAAELAIDAPGAPVPRFVHGATVVHPGAASEARRWPSERFAQVVHAEIRRGRTVVLTGGPDERNLAERIAARAGLPGRHVLAGATDLRGLAAVVAASGRVLCGDTGVAHLATALRRPSILLFGPTSPAEWGPIKGPHTVLWAGRAGDPHADRPDPGLLRIRAKDVIRELAAL